MGIIYKIENIKNHKVYIGQTHRTIDERWVDHCRERIRERSKHRPLYVDMNKFGLDVFTINSIETVPNDQLDAREKYWIEYYHSNLDGYNIALGGKGKPLYKHNDIISLIKKGKMTKEISKQIGCSVYLIRQISFDNNLTLNVVDNDLKIQMLDSKIPVVQKDFKNNIVNVFTSLTEAAHWLSDNNNIIYSAGVRSHISDVCKNKRKSAYGYLWEYA